VDGANLFQTGYPVAIR